MCLSNCLSVLMSTGIQFPKTSFDLFVGLPSQRFLSTAWVSLIILQSKHTSFFLYCTASLSHSLARLRTPVSRTLLPCLISVRYIDPPYSTGPHKTKGMKLKALRAADGWQEACVCESRAKTPDPTPNDAIWLISLLVCIDDQMETISKHSKTGRKHTFETPQQRQKPLRRLARRAHCQPHGAPANSSSPSLNASVSTLRGTTCVGGPLI